MSEKIRKILEIIYFSKDIFIIYFMQKIANKISLENFLKKFLGNKNPNIAI